MKVHKIKKELPLSKIEAKPTCSIGLPKWQEKKLQKLSTEKLKEKGLAWVLIEEFKLRKMLSWRFAPNHQNHWSWHHPYSLPMPIWNSSPSMHGYPLAPYFDLWYVSICFGGLPNYFAYQ
jgi:hypothetical protein